MKAIALKERVMSLLGGIFVVTAVWLAFANTL